MDLQTYHNASKSEANVRVLVVIRLGKSMNTDLKYPYVSTRSDALWQEGVSGSSMDSQMHPNHVFFRYENRP